MAHELKKLRGFEAWKYGEYTIIEGSNLHEVRYGAEYAVHYDIEKHGRCIKTTSTIDEAIAYIETI